MAQVVCCRTLAGHPSAMSDPPGAHHNVVRANVHGTDRVHNLYEIDKNKLGEGTYGSVCKVIHKVTRQVRAMKTISKATTPDLVRLNQEIDIMTQMDHPNIVRMYETYQDTKNVYIIMELLTGGELFDRITEMGCFTEDDARNLMKQIAGAIFYCHNASIMHRDLKPENFIMQNKKPDSPLKVIDFGLAATFKSGDRKATKAGTPYYVAPNVLASDYNEKCDVWSMGVIQYILLCGFPPFWGDTDAEILDRVRVGEFDFPEPEWDAVSDAAKTVIQQMLMVDETKRLSAEQVVNDPWFKQAGGAAPQLHDKVMGRIKQFQSTSKLKRIALQVMANQLDNDELEEAKNAFLAIDANGDGTLTYEELKAGLEKISVNLPPNFLSFLDQIDVDKSGRIDYSEFVAATMEKKKFTERDRCWAAFRTFDINGDGTITKEELMQVIENPDLRIDNAAQFISEVDSNQDGRVDFEEFMAMMLK